MWKCRFRANEGRDLVRERIRADVMDFVPLPTTVTKARYDGQEEPEDCGLHSDRYRPVSNAMAPKYPLRNYATGSVLGQPRSEYARSLMPTSEYARSARCNVYDDIDLADDEIAQKLREMRPRKTFTVDSDEEIEDEQDKVAPYSKMHYSNAPSLILRQSQVRSVPSADQYEKMLEKYGNTIGKTSLL